ncbi:MAG: glycoside hydrolase family 28 protein [Rhodobacteraceae bacterium]|nr:glycoside hydrolase family 28 protein [Paracoccaceae bacterium]
MTALSLASLSARTACLLVTPPGTRYHLAAPLAWSCVGEGRILARGQTTVAPVFLEGLSPDTEYEFSIGRAALAFRTAPCAGLVDITDHGAAPDLPDNAPAIASALAALPEGGTLRVPPGRFAISPVFLKAKMTLWLQEGAELHALHDRAGWPILPPRDSANRVLGTWEGLPEATFAAPLTAVDCDGLTITGLGVLDAGGERGDWWSWPKETRDGARRPRALFLAHGQGVQLSGITVRNSPSWTVHPYRIDGLTCAGLKIQNPPDSPNTDGLNPESCTDVTLAGIHFSVGDDCIAVKSGKRGTGALKGLAEHLAPTRRLHVHHCLMERGHGGMVLGSEMSGDITDVTVAACEFIGTDRGLRIKTRRGRGGEVARVHFSDVLMQGVGTPLAINAFYYCDPDGRSTEVQSRTPATVDETTPRIHDITFSDVIATDVQVCAVAVLGLPEAPVTGVRLENFRASLDPTAPPQAPLMADGVEPVAGLALWSDYAEVTGEIAPLEEQEAPQC